MPAVYGCGVADGECRFWFPVGLGGSAVVANRDA
jgi:hypothetical protein